MFEVAAFIIISIISVGVTEEVVIPAGKATAEYVSTVVEINKFYDSEVAE